MVDIQKIYPGGDFDPSCECRQAEMWILSTVI